MYSVECQVQAPRYPFFLPCLAAGTSSPLPSSLTPGQLLQRSLRSTSSHSLFTFPYPSHSLFLHMPSLFPRLPHGFRTAPHTASPCRLLRHNPSHALHDPVPVQTHPWLSSPLLRYLYIYIYLYLYIYIFTYLIYCYIGPLKARPRRHCMDIPS